MLVFNNEFARLSSEGGTGVFYPDFFLWWWGGLVEATVSFIGVDNHSTHKVYRYLLNTSKYALHVTLTIVAEFLLH